MRMEKLIKSNFKFQLKSKWLKGKAFLLLKGNNSKNTLVSIEKIIKKEFKGAKENTIDKKKKNL